jgi:glycosyltransferase involved in cell wall biosynthesis
MLRPVTADAPFLSVVIPAYNEERRLPASLDALLAFLDTQPFRSEVVIVETGSRDATLAVARRYAGRDPRVRVFSETRRGKGVAIRRGMREARGEWRFMCDADFSMSPEEIPRFLPPCLPDADVAIASREAPGALRGEEPALRRLAGRAWNALVRATLLPGLRDTQCGFKCFRGAIASDLFARQRAEGFAFDVEVLLLARQRGCRIVEVGAPIRHDADTRVRLLGDSLRMLSELAAIWWRARRGAYG